MIQFKNAQEPHVWASAFGAAIVAMMLPVLESNAPPVTHSRAIEIRSRAKLLADQAVFELRDLEGSL